jgi:hypothetical protein
MLEDRVGDASRRVFAKRSSPAPPMSDSRGDVCGRDAWKYGGAATRGETPRKNTANRALDSIFAPFVAKKTQFNQFNPTQLQFHSTFGCDFHRIERVSSAQGI